MNIEIHQPELEAMILARMQTGRFENVEEILIDALRATEAPPAGPPDDRRTISQVFAAARGLAEDLDVTREDSYDRPVDLS